jgi:hypothetical protein
VTPASFEPLAECYAEAGLELPAIVPIPGTAVPEPYQTLLVHENDMTPTLERHHGSRIHLRVLRSRRKGPLYHREVVLVLDRSDAAVEFGANRITLDRYPPEAQELILKEVVPVGSIFAMFQIAHTCRPSAYFRVEADPLISSELGVPLGATLYGRCNTVRTPEGQPLSEVVEILPLLPLAAS